MSIVNNVCNSVAMTVLPNAPIDPATGLQIPTIAVGTNGGISVIKDDGSVVDWTKGTYTVAGQVEFRQTDNALCVAFDTNTTGRFRHVLYNIPDADISDSSGLYKGQSDEFYPMFFSTVYTGTDIPLSSSATLYSNGWNGLADAGSTQLSLIAPNQANPSSGMLAAISSTYNTGWMNGDIKGAWLSDTDTADLVGGELVTNGTFDTDVSGWTSGNGAILSSVAGELRLQGNGSNANPYAYQAFNTVIGETYTLSVECVLAGSGFIQLGESYVTTGNRVTEPTVTTGTVSVTYIATTTTTYARVGFGSATADFTVDNISVKLAVEDRSYNGKGLQVNGTITRIPVATGADLVAYSGFSASNYLEQPYNADMPLLATDPFTIKGWFNCAVGAATNQNLFVLGTGAVGENRQVGIDSTNGELYLGYYGSTTIGSSTVDVRTGTWKQFIATNDGSGNIIVYVDGQIYLTDTTTLNDIGVTAVTIVGMYLTGANPANETSLALWSISKTLMTAEQATKCYEDEKVLFQEGAQATLYGTSDNVTALVHDDSTDVLEAGTSDGRSSFSGLRRVSNTTTAVTTAISADDGLIVEQ